MFDIGFWELLIIAIVLLLVMGPERLPEVARKAAYWVRRLREQMFHLRNQMQNEIGGTPFADLQAARQEMAELKNDLRQLGSELADAESEKNRKAAAPRGIGAHPAQADEDEPSQVASQATTQKRAPAKVAKTPKSGTPKNKTAENKATKKRASKARKKVTKKSTKVTTPTKTAAPTRKKSAGRSKKADA